MKQMRYSEILGRMDVYKCSGFLFGQKEIVMATGHGVNLRMSFVLQANLGNDFVNEI